MRAVLDKPLIRHDALVAARRRAGRPWTEDELEAVRLGYRGTITSARNIASVLGRTPFGVKGQVQKLGVTRTKPRNWTADEDEQLIELMGKHPPQQVAKRMHRSVNAVIMRSKRLGFSRRTRDGWYTKMDVCQMLGVDHHWLQPYINRGELQASWHYGTRPGQAGMACWHINEKDLREFIIAHCYDLVGRNADLPGIVYVLTGDQWPPSDTK